MKVDKTILNLEDEWLSYLYSVFSKIVSTKLLGISVYFCYSFIVVLRQLPSIQLLMFYFQCFIWGHNRKRNSIIRFFWQVHLLFLFVASDNGTEEYLYIKLLNVSERTLILISSFCWCIFTLVNIHRKEYTVEMIYAFKKHIFAQKHFLHKNYLLRQ